ncbi:MAG: hypothetical protein WCF84_13310 [Anaerolineae bacterium]
MKRPMCFAIVFVFLALVLAACQNNAPPPSASQPTDVPQPTGAPQLPTAPALTVPAPGEGDLALKGFLESADGQLRVVGNSPLFLSLKSMSNPPAAPGGWEFVGPVFDVIAQDRDRRPVQKLAAALRLRFQAPVGLPATVLVYNGSAWDVVLSEWDADGSLVADVEHLTPYVAGAPRANPSGAAPKATVTTGTPAANAAQTALESAVAAVKGKKVAVTSAARYTGSLAVTLPDVLQKAVTSVNVSGVEYYGLYNAVNEALTAQAKSGGSQGTFTLLVEPKTAMPASAADARKSLAALFPGASVTTLAQTRADSSGYVFYGKSGSTAYSAGYVVYNGLTLAYAAVGTGTFQQSVPTK